MMGRIARALLAVSLLALAPVPPPQDQAPVASTTIDDITYRWRRARNAHTFGNRIWTERTRGASATLRFTGDRVVWFTVKAPSQGRARVTIDGELVRGVNNHAAERREDVRRRFRNLGPGTHKLRIVVRGRPGADGGGPWISIQAFKAGGEIIPASAATYRWARRRVAGAHAGDLRVSSARGADARVTFTGKGLDWVAVEGPHRGRGAFSVDGELFTLTDDHSDVEATDVLYSAVGLTDARHTARVHVRRNPRTRSVAIDRFVIRRPSIRAFRGFGAWVDLFDYAALDPAATAAMLKEHGVRTLYLQTARYNSDSAFLYPDDVGAWVDAARAEGLRIVGWYLPAYDEHLKKDVRRTAAIASFRSPTGKRFHALAVDIEYKGETESLKEFNDGIRTHLRRVRKRIGNRYPMGAIVPAPVAMARAPSSWTGFPWKAIGRYADVVMPMAYWSYRLADGSCAENDLYCAAEYTSENIRRSQKKTGLRVHVIGGVADDVTKGQIEDFVASTLASRAIGGGLYDVRTTSKGGWTALQPLAGA